MTMCMFIVLAVLRGGRGSLGADFRRGSGNLWSDSIDKQHLVMRLQSMGGALWDCPPHQTYCLTSWSRTALPNVMETVSPA